MHIHSSPCHRVTSRAQNGCLEEEQVMGNAVCTYGCFLILLLPAQSLQSKDALQASTFQHLPAATGSGWMQKLAEEGEERREESTRRAEPQPAALL